MTKKEYKTPLIKVIKIDLKESIAVSGETNGSGLWEEIY